MQTMPTNSYPGYSIPGTGYAVQTGWNGPPGMTQQQWPTQGPYHQTYSWEQNQVQMENAEVHQGANDQGNEEVNAYYDNPYLQQYQKQQGVPPPPMYPNVRSNQQLWQPPPQQWGGNQKFAQQQYQRGPYQGQQFQQRPQNMAPQQKAEVDVSKMMKEIEEYKAQLAEFKRKEAERCEKADVRPPGQLPSKTVNPRADVNAVELRSGRVLPTVEPLVIEPETVEEEGAVNLPQKETVLQRLQRGDEVDVQILPAPPLKTQRLPFPQRAKKQADDRGRRAFYEKLKNTIITIPFAEALRSIPSYTKYMKDFTTNKSIGDAEQVCLTEASSNVLQGRLPKKLKIQVASQSHASSGTKSLTSAYVILAPVSH